MKRAKVLPDKPVKKTKPPRTVTSPNGNELTPFTSENNRGRPVGSMNKTTRILKEAGIMAAQLAGRRLTLLDKRRPKSRRELDPEAGDLVNYLVWHALNEPRAYLNFLRGLLPLQIFAQHDDRRTYRTVAEVEEEMRRRGLDQKLLALGIDPLLRPMKDVTPPPSK